eukprot:846013-Lingulodinium_polyedra.AAC.1
MVALLRSPPWTWRARGRPWRRLFPVALGQRQHRLAATTDRHATRPRCHAWPIPDVTAGQGG